MAGSRGEARRFGSRLRRRRWVASVAVLVGLAAVTGLLSGCDATPVMVSGTVRTEFGALKGTVPVRLYADDAETLVASTTTNGVGHYQFQESAVPGGTYRLRIGDQWWPDASSWASASPLVLTAASTSTADAVLAGAAFLNGSGVLPDGSPAAGVAVYAVDDAGQVVASTLMEADGTYFLGLPATGVHTVRMTQIEAGTTVAVGGDTATTFSTVDGDVVDVGVIDVTTGLPWGPGPTTTTTTTTTPTLPSECEEQFSWGPPVEDPPITEPGGPLPQYTGQVTTVTYAGAAAFFTAAEFQAGTDERTFSSVQVQIMTGDGADLRLVGVDSNNFFALRAIGIEGIPCVAARSRAVNASGVSPWVLDSEVLKWQYY